jgi:hypothetical protein
MSVWAELKRRNVVKVANNLFPPLGLPRWTQTLVTSCVARDARLLVARGLVRRRLHAKRRAADDSRDDRRQAVIVFRGRMHDGTDLRHIVILELAAEPVQHELLRQSLHELIVAL